MEMERINDDTIRVVVTNDDLAERNISVIDLLGNQDKIEEFFYSILEEIDIEGDFENNEAVTFQVLPNKNGLELFISKNIDDKSVMEGMLNSVLGKRDISDAEDDVSDEVLDALLDNDDSKPRSTQKLTKEEAQKIKATQRQNLVDSVGFSDIAREQNLVLQFDNFENVIQFSLNMAKQQFAFGSQLVKYQEKFFYVIKIDHESLEYNYTMADLKAMAYEFAQIPDISPDVLIEHGQIIFKNDAMTNVATYFG
ncbi:adaptor protein MecA [Weissella sagaensis]|jgi:adapter protein MecA 1/2|uniref:Adaptor protein MecA n=1 Tax=Weissella sagaensis TaxID=2559928 RepID=A0ABW1RT82_9LACO|nr:adaptor protein MecA [Weissella sagaensis]KAA8432823.1 competence protein [Weissella paramesenteroides]KAA8437927.1 competence protein [Weissella paramesenteroides]MBU7568357.1 adaptor protein MecA [Weissella hellenica]QEA56401.1 competence protein [Weissella hellenica]